MVLYFTGTGNSRYVAERIAVALGDELLSMNDRIKAGDTSPVTSDERLVIVIPTYAWRIPPNEQHHDSKRQACLGRQLYPLHGLYLPLRCGSHRVRQKEHGKAQVSFRGALKRPEKRSLTPKVYAEVPLRVEYTLTETGYSV